jgi:hypothetical protein
MADEMNMDEETLAIEAACDGGNHAAKAVQSCIDKLKSEIALLQEAIRRLADQDATLSVAGGNVTVTMDATLTDAEREAIAFMLRHAAVAAERDK